MRYLYLLLLFALSFSLFGEWVFTDEQYLEMMKNQKITAEKLEENKTTIADLEKTNENLKKSNETEQSHLNKIIELQEKQMTELEKYSDQQKKESLLEKITNFFIGFLAGACISTMIYLINISS